MKESERPRLSRDHLHDLMLDAGMELLQEEGLGSGTAPVGYADAFRWLAENRKITVSRAQVHRRIWDSVADYRHDVLASISTNPPTDGYNDAVVRALSTLPDLDIDQLSVDERLRVLVDFARTMTRTNAQFLKHREAMAAYDAVEVLQSFGGAKPTAELRGQIQVSDAQILDRYSAIYTYVAHVFGCSPGADLGLDWTEGIELYAELLDVINHGSSGRSSFETELEKLRLGDEEWTVEGLVAAAATSAIASLNNPPAAERPDDAVISASDLHTVEPEIAKPPAAAGRLDRQTLRNHMIDAGIGVLIERGFGHGADQITYGRVFERLKEQQGLTISRAQVHGRIWESQEEFQVDLVARAVLHADPDFVADGVAAIFDVVSDLDLTTVEGRRRAIAIAGRIGSQQMVSDTRQSSRWNLSKGIMAFHALNPHRHPQIGAALDRAYKADLEAWAVMFESMAAATNYVPQAWTGRSVSELCAILASCADVLFEGVLARARRLGRVSTYDLSIEGGEPEEWNLFGVGIWCLVEFVAEPAA